MKSKYLLYSLACLLITNCASDTKAKPLIFTYDRAILKEDLPELIINCGAASVANALIFKSSKSDSTIVGIIMCVNLYGRNFFKKDSIYKLELSSNLDSLKNWFIEDPYKGSQYPVYLVTHIAKAN